MSGTGRPFLRAGERVKQAREEGKAPGVVLEDLLAPGATSTVQFGDLQRKVEAGERVGLSGEHDVGARQETSFDPAPVDAKERIEVELAELRMLGGWPASQA